MLFRSLIVTGLVLGAAAPAMAQQRISEGSQLRIEVQQPNLGSTSSYQGTLVYSSERFSLHAVDPAADGGVIPVSLSGVTRIEMAQPRDRGRSARRGATVMGFIGGSLGLIAGPILASTNHEFGPMVAKSTAVGLGAGVALGGVTGALFARDGWQRYTVPAEWR